MTLRFMDGMYYPTADLLLKYSEVGFSPQISSETRRVASDIGSIYLQVSTDPKSVTYSPGTPLVGATCGFAFKLNNTPGELFKGKFVEFGNTGVSLETQTNFSIKMFGGGTSITSDPAIFDVNVWSYLELQYTKSPTVATVTLKINGIIKAVLTGKNIDVDLTYLKFRGDWDSASIYIQDLYLLDSLGTVNNDFLGDLRVDCIRPDGAGTNTDFTPSSGANWENVDEYAMDSDTTYNKSAVIGDKDSYNLGSISATGAPIFGVQQQSVVRKDDASIRYGKQLLKSGATEDLGSELQFNDTYTGYHRILETDPNTAVAWSETGINALESGITVTA